MKSPTPTGPTLAALSASERRLLVLLSQLPLIYPTPLAAVAGIACQATAKWHLRRLQSAGLIGRLKVAVRPGHSPAALYLTDRGLSAASLLLGEEASAIARRNGLGGAALRGAIPGLVHLGALYEMLAAVCDRGVGVPRLRLWQRPWRVRFRPRLARAQASVAIPGHARLAWDDGQLDVLLLPDLATYPVRARRLTILRLAQLAAVASGPLPALVIATDCPERGEAWRALVAQVARARGAGSLSVWIVDWANLREDLASCLTLQHLSGPLAGPRWVGADLTGRESPTSGRRLVANPAAASGATKTRAACLGQIALTLLPSDHLLLDTLGRHPFLRAGQLGDLLGWAPAWAAQRCHRLRRRGLLLELQAGDPRGGEHTGPWEVSAVGLRLVAARQGLSLAQAVHYNGLAGGGLREPVGTRTSLARHLRHTLGVNALFVRLAATAALRRRQGYDDELAEWRGAAACARRALRPDGYGLYRHAGQLYGFFLEYDRGTTNRRDYSRKFAAYFDHLTRGRHKADYTTFPTVLCVATDDATERRLAQALVRAGVGRPALPALLTTEWRSDDPRNERGLLGPIWREPQAAWEERRYWPLGGDGGPTVGPTAGQPAPCPGGGDEPALSNIRFLSGRIAAGHSATRPPERSENGNHQVERHGQG